MCEFFFEEIEGKTHTDHVTFFCPLFCCFDITTYTHINLHKHPNLTVELVLEFVRVFTCLLRKPNLLYWNLYKAYCLIVDCN